MNNSNHEKLDLTMDVKKESESGMFNNNRLLLIKSGFISYYSKKPQDYVGNMRSLQLSGQLPKLSISAAKILSVQYKDRAVIMKFHKNNLIDLETLQKLITDIQQRKKKGKQQTVQWQFKSKDKNMIQTFLQQVKLYKDNPSLKPSLTEFIKGYKQGHQRRKVFRHSSIEQLKNNDRNSRYSQFNAITGKSSSPIRLSDFLNSDSTIPSIKQPDGLILESRDSIVLNQEIELIKIDESDVQKQGIEKSEQTFSTQKQEFKKKEIPKVYLDKKQEHAKYSPYQKSSLTKKSENSHFQRKQESKKPSQKDKTLNKNEQKDIGNPKGSKQPPWATKVLSKNQEHDVGNAKESKEPSQKAKALNKNEQKDIGTPKGSKQPPWATKVLSKKEEKEKGNGKYRDLISKAKQSSNQYNQFMDNLHQQKSNHQKQSVKQSFKKKAHVHIEEPRVHEEKGKKGLEKVQLGQKGHISHNLGTRMSPVNEIKKEKNQHRQQLEKDKKPIQKGDDKIGSDPKPKVAIEPDCEPVQQSKLIKTTKSNRIELQQPELSPSQSESNSGENLMTIAEKMTEISQLLMHQAEKHINKKKFSSKSRNMSEKRSNHDETSSVNLSSKSKEPHDDEYSKETNNYFQSSKRQPTKNKHDEHINEIEERHQTNNQRKVEDLRINIQTKQTEEQKKAESNKEQISYASSSAEQEIQKQHSNENNKHLQTNKDDNLNQLSKAQQSDNSNNQSSQQSSEFQLTNGRTQLQPIQQSEDEWALRENQIPFEMIKENENQEKRVKRAEKMKQIFRNICSELVHEDSDSADSEALSDNIKSRVLQRMANMDDIQPEQYQEEMNEHSFSIFIDQMMDKIYNSKSELFLPNNNKEQINHSHIESQHGDQSEVNKEEDLIKTQNLIKVQESQQSESKHLKEQNSQQQLKKSKNKDINENQGEKKEEERQIKSNQQRRDRMAANMIQSVILQNQGKYIQDNKQSSKEFEMQLKQKLYQQRQEKLMIYLSRIKLEEISKRNGETDLPQLIIQQLESEISIGIKTGEAINLFLTYVLSSGTHNLPQFTIKQVVQNIILGNIISRDGIKVCLGPQIFKIIKLYEILSASIPQELVIGLETFSVVLPKVYLFDFFHQSQSHQALTIIYETGKNLKNRQHPLFQKLFNIVHQYVDHNIEKQIVKNCCQIVEDVLNKKLYVYVHPILCCSIDADRDTSIQPKPKQEGSITIKQVSITKQNEGIIQRLYNKIIPKYLAKGSDEFYTLAYMIIKLKGIQLLIRDWIEINPLITQSYSYLFSQDLQVKNVDCCQFHELVIRICLLKLSEQKPVQSIALCHKLLQLEFKTHQQIEIEKSSVNLQTVQKLFLLFISSLQSYKHKILDNIAVDKQEIDDIIGLYTRIEELLLFRSHKSQKKNLFQDFYIILIILLIKYLTIGYNYAIMNDQKTEGNTKSILQENYIKLIKLIFQSQTCISPNILQSAISCITDSLVFNNRSQQLKYYLQICLPVIQQASTFNIEFYSELKVKLELFSVGQDWKSAKWKEYIDHLWDKLKAASNHIVFLSLLFQDSEHYIPSEKETPHCFFQYTQQFQYILAVCTALSNSCFNSLKRAQQLCHLISKAPKLDSTAKIKLMKTMCVQMEPSISKFMRKQYIQPLMNNKDIQ